MVALLKAPRACGYGSTFLQMFDEGGEDYSQERKSSLRKNLHEISREIRGLKKKAGLCYFLRQEESPERISPCACHPQRNRGVVIRIVSRIPDADKQKQEELIAGPWIKLKEPGNILTAILESLPIMALNATITLLIAGIFVPLSFGYFGIEGSSFSFQINLPVLVFGALGILFTHELIHLFCIPDFIRSETTILGVTSLRRICLYGRTTDPDTLSHHQLCAVYHHFPNPALCPGHAESSLSGSHRFSLTELPGIFRGYPDCTACARSSPFPGISGFKR